MYNSNDSSKITHIAGTFVISAKGSFLNGAGLGEGEDRNISIVKTFQDGQYRIPYVSSQAWKRWLRNTLIEETNWPQSEIKALHVNAKGNTDKIGGEFNPIEYPEDDLFGYMRTEKGSGKTTNEEDESVDVENGTDVENKVKGKKVKSIMRKSPFSASILVSLRKTGWKGRDEGFVHLKEGTPQPYTTEFYNTNLQGVFCLDYNRLGIFSNIGDRIELDESKANAFIQNNKIKIVQNGGKSGNIYEIIDAQKYRKERAAKLLESLSKLRGGAKQAAFGTDVSPKILIVAGLSCGNPIFNNIFTDDGKSFNLDTEILKEIVLDYKDRISTPVFIGIRQGYLTNEQDVKKLEEYSNVKFIVTTPINAAIEMGKLL